MISPTAAEWNKMTAAQKVSFLRKVNYGGAAAGAVVGWALAGPFGAVVMAIGTTCFASWYAHKNLPGGLF